MCEKQCRDENGFKCHLTSEGHKRQMMVFGQNPDRGMPSAGCALSGSQLECPADTCLPIFPSIISTREAVQCALGLLALLSSLGLGAVISDYTTEFKEGFLALLKQAHGQTRVSAKVVYNEYINDRNHVHMNATNWLTLTDFVK